MFLLKKNLDISTKSNFLHFNLFRALGTFRLQNYIALLSLSDSFCSAKLSTTTFYTMKATCVNKRNLFNKRLTLLASLIMTGLMIGTLEVINYIHYKDGFWIRMDYPTEYADPKNERKWCELINADTNRFIMEPASSRSSYSYLFLGTWLLYVGFGDYFMIGRTSRSSRYATGDRNDSLVSSSTVETIFLPGYEHRTPLIQEYPYITIVHGLLNIILGLGSFFNHACECLAWFAHRADIAGMLSVSSFVCFYAPIFFYELFLRYNMNISYIVHTNQTIRINEDEELNIDDHDDEEDKYLGTKNHNEKADAHVSSRKNFDQTANMNSKSAISSRQNQDLKKIALSLVTPIGQILIWILVMVEQLKWPYTDPVLFLFLSLNLFTVACAFVIVHYFMNPKLGNLHIGAQEWRNDVNSSSSSCVNASSHTTNITTSVATMDRCSNYRIQYRINHWYLACSITLFFVAVGAWFLGLSGHWCQNNDGDDGNSANLMPRSLTWLQAHAVWHVLTCGALLYMYLFFRVGVITTIRVLDEEDSK